MNRRLVLLTDAVLVGAILIDVVLCGMTWVAPDLWFETLHGAPADPAQLAFLRRCGAHWAAFAVFQLVALLRWRSGLYWLLLAAGMRLSDLLTDLTYLASSATLTPSGTISLLAPFWLNLGMALILIYAFRVEVGADRWASLRHDPQGV